MTPSMLLMTSRSRTAVPDSRSIQSTVFADHLAQLPTPMCASHHRFRSRCVPDGKQSLRSKGQSALGAENVSIQFEFDGGVSTICALALSSPGVVGVRSRCVAH